MPWLPGGQRPWPPSYAKAQLEGPQKCGQPRSFPDSSEHSQPHPNTMRHAVSRRPPKKPEATNYYVSRQRPPDTSGDLQRPTQPMHTPVIRPTTTTTAPLTLLERALAPEETGACECQRFRRFLRGPEAHRFPLRAPWHIQGSRSTPFFTVFSAALLASRDLQRYSPRSLAVYIVFQHATRFVLHGARLSSRGPLFPPSVRGKKRKPFVFHAGRPRDRAYRKNDATAILFCSIPNPFIVFDPGAPDILRNL